MHRTSRLGFLLGCLLLGAAAVWSGGEERPTGPPPAPPLYHPDPQHLWNRLPRALWVRVGPDGKTYGGDRLDPLLWMDSKYLLQGKAHEQAVAVLDEFLAERGENLVKDPLKRAILQRDLWAVFDWAAEPGAPTEEAYLGRTPSPRRALQVRLAHIIQRLALTPEQIKALPENYAAAVASGAFAEEYDPDPSPLTPDFGITDSVKPMSCCAGSRRWKVTTVSPGPTTPCRSNSRGPRCWSKAARPSKSAAGAPRGRGWS